MSLREREREREIQRERPMVRERDSEKERERERERERGRESYQEVVFCRSCFARAFPFVFLSVRTYCFSRAFQISFSVGQFSFCVVH